MNLLPVPPSHNWGCDDCLEAVVSGMLLAFRLAQEVYGGECAVDALIAELEVEK